MRKYLPPSIIKLEHWQQPSEHRSRYLAGLALDCFLNQNNDRNSHYLGRELLWTGRPNSAIKELLRHISMGRWPAERAQSMIFVADAYKALQRDEAIEWYHKAFLTESARREALIRLGTYFYEKGDAQKTACYMAAALEIPETAFYANDLAHYTHYPHELLYWAKWALGDKEGSKYHFDKAFSYKPHHGKFLHDYRYYYELPKVSFVLPTLGREEGLKKCLDSIKALNYPQEKIEIIVKQDTFESPIGVPNLVKQGVEESTGEWIVFASNDIEFDSNSLIEAYTQGIKAGKRLVAFDTGVRNAEGYICEHFMIKRDLIPLIGGEVFCTRLKHVGCDDLLWKKCDKLGAAMISTGKVKHTHFSRIGSGVEYDEVNKLGWEHAEEDRKTLEEELSKI